jgi:hypothetical protein
MKTKLKRFLSLYEGGGNAASIGTLQYMETLNECRLFRYIYQSAIPHAVVVFKIKANIMRSRVRVRTPRASFNADVILARHFNYLVTILIQ